MRNTSITAGGAAPRHGALPRTPRGLRPCDPEKLSFEGKIQTVVSLPLVGLELYTLFGWLSRPWVTFLVDPAETDPGYIFK
jgi:hypothetical protein